MTRHKRVVAFTLIELLTVIAITAILMTFMIVPVVQSFNMLRAGQGWSEAQERGRVLVERISRELGEATGIRDNSGSKGTVAVVVPSRNGGGFDNSVEVLLPFAKIDIMKASSGEPIRGPGGGYIDPSTGKEDPTLLAPKGQVVLPAAPGFTYVRYFIGLRRPVTPVGGGFGPGFYNNPYDALLMQRNGQQDNLYVLFRVEYQPFEWDANQGRYVVNTDLFLDLDGDNQPDDFDDPYFFTLRPLTAGGAVSDYDNSGQLIQGDPIRGQAKAERMFNWLRRATIMTDIHRFDMIQPLVDRGATAAYNNVTASPVVTDGPVPIIMPLAQFRPTRISSEPAASMTAVRQSDEGEGMAFYAPDKFRTIHGGWVSNLVKTYPAGWVQGDPYLIGRADPVAQNGPFSIFYFDPLSGQTEQTGGVQLFSVAQYDYATSQGLPYPFSQSLNLGNLGTQALRDAFIPYYTERRSGQIVASFGINEVGNPAIPPQPINPNNLPFNETGPEVVPANQPTSPGNFYDAQYNSVNANFVWVWNNRPELRPNVHRFIDLRVTPNADGTPSPLNPNPMVGFSRAKIVPGSERVYGPDQEPGPNYGNMIQYQRTTGEPGPNQYRINYVDRNEPDYALLGLPNPPAAYDPQDFMSAIYQPRFKAGYLQLNSDPTVPLPGANPNRQIQVYYKFQMTSVIPSPGGNGPVQRDVMSVDYDTRELISILLTMRNYPQTTVPNPQTITLRSNAKVRNFLR